MRALNLVAKVIKNFVPVIYNDNGTTTPLNPKPKTLYGKVVEEQAFFVIEQPTTNLTQIQNTTRIQIIYKHKEKSLGMGMIEASNIAKDLKQFLLDSGISYNDNIVPVGFHNDFYVYSLNFNVDENK